MPNVPRLALLLLAVTTFAPACGESECEKAYDMFKKCESKGEKDFPPKSVFAQVCEAAKSDPESKEEIETELTCAKQDSCDAMKACKQGARGKKAAKKVADAVAGGKWSKAFDDCTTFDNYYADESFKAECVKVFAGVGKLTGKDAEKAMSSCKYGSSKIKKLVPEFEKACGQLAASELTTAQKTVTAARDAGKRDFKACMDLKELAKMAGGDAVGNADKLCEEADIAEDAKKGADEARKNAAAKNPDMPYQCEMAAEKLEKLGTEWSKKTLDDLLKACYVELGAVTIEEKGKDAKSFCPFQIKKVTDAIAKRDLATKFPEVADLMKKLPKSCQVKDK